MFPLVLLGLALPTAGQQVEAYPIPISAEISVGANSRGAKAPAPPAPAEKALVVVAPRNGVANGQILLKAQGAAATTSVAVCDLKGPGGAAFPAAKVQVRYGQYITGEKALSVYRWRKDIGASAAADEDRASSYNIAQGLWRVDCLLPTAQCQVEENLPRCAWLTFSVSPEAAPGLYKGTATVAGAGATVPIELEIVDAMVPDPADSAMSNDVRPMWEVIAFGNGIPLEECWKSERFWKVTAAYLHKLGQLRMSNCGIAVMAPSTTSSLGMVRWVKKDEGWSWDYTVLDRFIATYRKSVGEPRVLDATALVHDEQRAGLSFLYTDADTGREGVFQMPDGQAAADLVVAFVRDLRAHLAKLGLDQRLALGIWHDKMQHTGGTIRQRLLQELPDLKVSLWAHSDGWGKPLKERVASYMSKCAMGPSLGYPIKIGMRRAFEKPISFGPYAWDAAARNYVGLGQVDLANWSEDRRAAEYTYYGAGMFTSWQRHLAYPMQDDQVVTGVLYELFREYAQDYDLIKLMQAQGVKTGFLADPRAQLDTISELDKFGRLFARGAPAQVDVLHHAILRQAGQAKARPEGK